MKCFQKKVHEEEKQIVNRNLKVLGERRQLVTEYWSKIPKIKFYKPKAAFYVYLDISETGMNSDHFSKFTLEKGICLVPGSAFGQTQASGMLNYCRMSFGMTNNQDIKDAAEILTEVLN
ncbi:MAG: LL-diaminopimelate aminotransferase [Candidatus Heimdallarchaeota archaeon LC_3]|nr:MAG: LL-diaminopimelate aminotransferase [Candidatus Heimdallarchaeota archaeon LC_3]